MAIKEPTVWIVRDFLRCSGCRRCEIACSLRHEGKIWPEASRIRIFSLVPGVDVPHLCSQCDDYPCVKACPMNALSINTRTGAVMVDKEACNGCGSCIEACPGNVPFLHPGDGKATICDLCDGDPQCAKVCQDAKFDALWTVVERPGASRKLFARTPESFTEDLAHNLYGEKAEEVV
ncbi:MAG: 4Fe-4S dicluster domain-containing protein [Candidatus Bathyarchaeia archaeon]